MTFFNKKTIALVLIIGIIIVAAFLVFYFGKDAAKEETTGQVTAEEHMAPRENGSSQQATIAPETKLYRNEEFGFEFEYPASWSFKTNSFYSPFSKFNIEAHSPDIPYNPFNPFFVINIVTADFADRAIISRENLGASTSTILIAGVEGIKYEYNFEDTLQVDVDIQFDKYRLLLSANKEYENVFNQILASFKFSK